MTIQNRRVGKTAVAVAALVVGLALGGDATQALVRGLRSL
jgi:hypothetical protein